MNRILAAAIAATLVTCARLAGAAETSDDELFRTAVAAFDAVKLDEAIDRFELLADRGFTHPDASYDRGLAYVQRAATRSPKPGDLGRAAAALSEALALRPDDGAAELALDRVRSEIARRRARVGATEVEQRVALGWAVVYLFEEDTWAILAALASLLASAGLVVRFLVRSTRRQLAGVVAASVGAFVLACAGSLAALARHDRLTTRTAVVITDEARLLDANGHAISGPGTIVPEGASVRVVGQEGTLARVEWGTLEGFVGLDRLRLIATR